MAKVLLLRMRLEEIPTILVARKSSVSIDEAVFHRGVEIAASGTYAVNFGPVTTASVLYVYGDRNLTYTFNAGSEAVTINANSPHLQTGCALTAMTITNADTADTAVVDVYLGGT